MMVDLSKRVPCCSLMMGLCLATCPPWLQVEKEYLELKANLNAQRMQLEV